MAANIAPYFWQKFFDNNGNPLAGGKIYTYIAGSDTPLATYTDESATVANTNPIILDANGECDIWMKDQYYKLVIKDSYDVVLKTVDRILGASNAGGAPTSINSPNSTYWYAPEVGGAVLAEEYGLEVYKFSKDANQRIKRLVNVPTSYTTGGEINMNVYLYSPDITNNVRLKLTVTLISKKIGTAISASSPQYTEERYIEFDVPQEVGAGVFANTLRSKQFILSANGFVGGEDIYPEDQLIVQLERVATNTGVEGADSAEDLRILKHNTEEVFS